MSFSIAFSQALEIAAYVNAKSKDQHFDYLAIQKISEMLNIPIPSIKKISATLKKNGILTSKTGINGGLRLAKPPQEITVYDIFAAIEGTGPLFKVHRDLNIQAFVNQKKVEHWVQNSSNVLEQAEETLLQSLKSTTLDDLDKSL